ncbi:MAG: bifunctional nuclease family protein [Victivallaceae bacterium]|nr:bifunctional nuclease family protein [Victivallaceae bacterium]
MKQVELSKIIIDEKRADQAIVLKEKDGDRQLPIMIGLVEASSIKMKLSNIELPRPLTHDLLIATIEGLSAKLERVVIDDIIGDTFHAKLVVIDKNDQVQYIDARPSDSIALAVRARAPIFVEDKVLNQASIPKNV